MNKKHLYCYNISNRQGGINYSKVVVNILNIHMGFVNLS